MPESKTEQQDLYQFMLNKLGGKDAVMADFLKERIAELAKDGGTLKVLQAEALKQGWQDFLQDIKLTELAAIISPSPAGAREKAGRKLG